MAFKGYKGTDIAKRYGKKTASRRVAAASKGLQRKGKRITAGAKPSPARKQARKRAMRAMPKVRRTY